MRAVIQRVSQASCTVEGQLTGKIENGLVVFLGIEEQDGLEDIKWLTQKIVNLRIFSDENGLMNRSIKDITGGILLISQFTLLAQTKKGNRPSFIKAARPEHAIPLYEAARQSFGQLLEKEIACGIFGADMKIGLINDGPVTIIMDTRDKDNH